MTLLPNEAVLQKALQYLSSPEGTVEINPDLKQKLDRWEYADQLIRRHGDMNQVVGFLTRKYKYSEATARRDIQAATYLFGSLVHYEVKYFQRFAVELLMKRMLKADAADDNKGFAALNREFRETVGINAKNQGIPLPGQLQRHTFIVTDELPSEEQLVYTREFIENRTMELLAKYKEVPDKTVPYAVDVTPTNHDDTDSTGS